MRTVLALGQGSAASEELYSDGTSEVVFLRVSTFTICIEFCMMPCNGACQGMPMSVIVSFSRSVLNSRFASNLFDFNIEVSFSFQ